MTKSEWMACTDPTRMLDFLRGKASNRKMRLFACACWRRHWLLLKSEKDRNAVILAEQFADGLAGSEDFPEAFDENGRSAWPYVCYPTGSDAPYHAEIAAYMCASAVADSANDADAAFAAERERQTDVIRDVFGPSPLRLPPASVAYSHPQPVILPERSTRNVATTECRSWATFSKSRGVETPRF